MNIKPIFDDGELSGVEIDGELLEVPIAQYKSRPQALRSLMNEIMNRLMTPDPIGARLCERCRVPLPADWDYAWCEDCGKHGVCVHGNRPNNCMPCMMESDRAYDANRER